MRVVNAADVNTPEGNDPTIMYRLSGISGVSPRNSGCFNNNNTENDPGMGHINRFLGRSESEEGNVYNSDSDVGVQHIRQALGIAADEQTDPGVAHVRRALGLRAGDIQRSPRGSQSDTALSQSTSSVNNNNDPNNMGSNAQSDAQCVAGHVAQRDEENNGLSRHRHAFSSVNTMPDDAPPTYQEALAILAREDEDFPPSYDDAVSTRS